MIKNYQKPLSRMEKTAKIISKVIPPKITITNKFFKKALSIDKDYDIAKISKDIAQDLLKSIKKEQLKFKTQ